MPEVNLYQIEGVDCDGEMVYVVAANIRDALAKYKGWIVESINSDLEPGSEPVVQGDIEDPVSIMMIGNQYQLVL